MRALDRKLFRDLAHMKGQVLAIIAVIGCGIGIYIGWQTTSVSLHKGLDDYYENKRFAEVFATLNRAPLSMADRVMEIPGVAAADARIVETVTLDIKTLDEPAIGKLISLPDRGQSKLNGIYLLQGRYPELGHPGEVIAEEAFVKANGFKPGDKIRAVMNGRLQTLQIVGIGMSPEYLITVQPGSIFPDDERFGIFWMRRSQMETAFDMEGAFNDLALSLLPGTRSEEVILQLDRLLDRYGTMGANDREHQLSHRFISDELAQLKVMTMIPPSIFLAVAAFLLNVVLRRILTLQRTQIAALKAFGYSSRQVGFHYGKLVWFIVLGGAIVGGVVGTMLGEYLSDMYSRFYRFPTSIFQLDPMAYITGIALSAASGFVGVFVAVKQAVKIQPAEAMRPEAPPDYKMTWFERLGWHRFLPGAPRMILRELVRRPMKAGLTSVGISFACAVLVVGNFGRDAIDFLIDFEFGLQQRHDVTVNFTEAVPKRVLSSLKHIQGVKQIEPFRMVPAKLVFGQYSRQLGIVGLADRRDLFRLLNEKMKVVDIPPNGLVISSHLAKILHLEVGDELTVEVLEKERPVRKVTVVSRVNDYSGLSAYMDIEALNRLMREPPSISGAFMTLDPKWENSAYRELKNTPFIGAVNLQKAAFKGFLDSFAENLLQLRVINVIFASVIAVGVVYNSARVTLSERSRELATLRVIGFTKGEVSAILLGELGFLTLVAIPLGWLLGYGLTWSIVKALPTEHVRIPLVLTTSTYGFAAVVILLAAIFSGLIVRRGIDHLDLVSVLKSSE